MNQMWFQNYLKKKAPHGDPQCADVPLGIEGVEGSREATNVLSETLEWHLNGKNKKAFHSVWRHAPEDTVCSVLDCRTEKRVENVPHPGGGVRGAESVINDKELHERIKNLGQQIREYVRTPEYHGRNMVIAVVGPGLGLGTEIRVARILHTVLALKWSDKARVRLFNFSQDDYPTYCTSGRCQECSDGQKAALHQSMIKIFAEKLALPDDTDEWGRLAYEKEAREMERKREKEKKEKEKKEKERKEKERKEEQRGRERDREQGR